MVGLRRVDEVVVHLDDDRGTGVEQDAGTGRRVVRCVTGHPGADPLRRAETVARGGRRVRMRLAQAGAAEARPPAPVRSGVQAPRLGRVGAGGLEQDHVVDEARPAPAGSTPTSRRRPASGAAPGRSSGSRRTRRLRRAACTAAPGRARSSRPGAVERTVGGEIEPPAPIGAPPRAQRAIAFFSLAVRMRREAPRNAGESRPGGHGGITPSCVIVRIAGACAAAERADVIGNGAIPPMRVAAGALGGEDRRHVLPPGRAGSCSARRRQRVVSDRRGERGADGDRGGQERGDPASAHAPDAN